VSHQPIILRFELVDTPKLHHHKEENHFSVFVGAEVLILQHHRVGLDKFIE
jgi:hypothetical protein